MKMLSKTIKSHNYQFNAHIFLEFSELLFTIHRMALATLKVNRIYIMKKHKYMMNKKKYHQNILFIFCFLEEKKSIN